MNPFPNLGYPALTSAYISTFSLTSSVENMHEWLDLRDIRQLKHFWVRKSKEKGYEIPLQKYHTTPGFTSLLPNCSC